MKIKSMHLLILAASLALFGCNSGQESASKSAVSAESKGYSLTERERTIANILLIHEVQVSAEDGDASPALVQRLLGDYVVATSDKLQKAYEKNEVAADQKFRKKTILANGIVKSIDRSVGENYFISLKGGSNMFMQPKASMADGYTDFLANLKKGDNVFLSCKGNGMLMGSAMLSNCEPLLNFASKISRKYVNKINIGETISKSDAPSRLELMLFVGSVAVATSLPDTSTCFAADGYGTKCLAEIKEVSDSKNKAKKEAFKSAMQSSGKKMGVDFDALKASLAASG